VRATLDHLALIQDNDFVAVSNRAQPMGYDQAGAAATPQVVSNLLLGQWIEGASRFV
jgi:hypothetical protein